MTCSIGGETLVEGTTYCDANNNLFKCINGSLVYQSTGCSPMMYHCANGTVVSNWADCPSADITPPTTSPTGGQCPSGYYFDPTTAECMLAESGMPSTSCLFAGDNGDVELPNGEIYTRGDGGQWICNSGTLNQVYSEGKPEADFYISPNNIVVGGTAVFVPQCTGGEPTSWDWDWDDGSSHGTGGGVKYHTYSKSGNFLPKLTVSNSSGSTYAVRGVSVAAVVTPPSPSTCNCTTEYDVFDPCATWTETNCAATTTPPVTPPALCSSSNCASPKTCVGGVCITPSTLCSAANCASPKTCVGGICTAPSTVCTVSNCPSPSSCVGGICTKPSSTTTTTACVGLNRNGKFDPTCILEKGNEKYLYAAVGLVVILLLIKK